MMPAPRAPIRIDPVFDDVEAFSRLVHGNGPFPSLQRRVMQSSVESAAITGEWVTDEMLAESLAGGSRSIGVTASYRSYWMQGGRPLRDGIDWLVAYDRFVDAAKRLLEAAVVRPDEIYVNAQVPQPVRPGSCHVDIPKFRGIGRREHPVWLLTTMRRSGLFERWRVPVATAVCWFYDGPGGTYTYWPDGPGTAPRQTSQPFSNSALVGENDTMFHRGDAVGPPGVVAPSGITLDCELGPLPGDASVWAIVDGSRTVARYEAHQIRLALSWSAEVYVDDEARRAADDHDDDLTLDAVISTFLGDLRDRGIPVDEPADPLGDLRFVAALARAYRVVPRAFPTTEETTAVHRREAALPA